MNAKEKLLYLFNMKHGNLNKAFSLEITFGNNSELVGVDVIKDGRCCWHETRESLLYHYSTKNLKSENQTESWGSINRQLIDAKQDLEKTLKSNSLTLKTVLDRNLVLELALDEEKEKLSGSDAELRNAVRGIRAQTNELNKTRTKLLEAWAKNVDQVKKIKELEAKLGA